MLTAAAAVIAAYAIGAVPVAWLAGRARGIDIRERGSGNPGASNVWQSVSKALVVPVGLAQIGQGFAAVIVARALGQDGAVQAMAGVASVAANDWNPLLAFDGGRGIGASIGVALALSPLALGAFIVIAVAGVAVRAIPQGVLLALAATPVAALAAGDGASAALGCAALVLLAIAKRLLGNAAPDPAAPRPGVWWNRLLYDRDIRDRDAWVRRDTTSARR